MICFRTTGSTSRCLHSLRRRGGSRGCAASLRVPSFTRASNSCRHDEKRITVLQRRFQGEHLSESGCSRHPAPSRGISINGLLRHHPPNAEHVMMSRDASLQETPNPTRQENGTNRSPCARWSVCRWLTHRPTLARSDQTSGGWIGAYRSP